MPYVNMYGRAPWQGVSQFYGNNSHYLGQDQGTSHAGIGQFMNQLLGQFMNPSSSSQGFQFLQKLAQQGGGSRAAYERGSAGAPEFYRQQMAASDPMGTIANTQDFAKKTYGVQSRGIDNAYSDAARQFRESTGGLNAGGANPRAHGFMKAVLGARQATDLGSLWGQSQAQETMMKQDALTQTASYRKAQADALREHGAALAGAQQGDQSYSAGLGSSMMQGELGQNQAVLGFLSQILGPLMQRQSYSQQGFANDDIMSFFRTLFGGGNP